MKKILVTGANGFIGENICKHLIKLNYFVRGAVRSLNTLSTINSEYILVGNIDAKTNWDRALEGVDCIIHCAGKVPSIYTKNKLDIFSIINTEGTKHLAEQAVKAKVKRLIFLSSVAIYGKSSDKLKDKLFFYYDKPNPQDNYSISKFEAEKVLWKIASKTDLEVIVLRLPLVHGYGAKNNLKRLINLINSRIPLPFESINNKRSLLGIDNLIDVLVRCIEHHDVAGKTLLLSDEENLSTPELIRLIALVLGQPAKLFKVPIFLLKFFGFILGKQHEIDRLTGSLTVDNNYAKEILNWTPSVSLEEGIRRMIKNNK